MARRSCAGVDRPGPASSEQEPRVERIVGLEDERVMAGEVRRPLDLGHDRGSPPWVVVPTTR